MTTNDDDDGRSTVSVLDEETAVSEASASSASVNDVESSSSSAGTSLDSIQSNVSSSDHTIKGQLARKETLSVNRLRNIFFLILVLAGVGVSVLVYFISKSSNEAEMVKEFQLAHSRLSEAFAAIRTERIATLAGLAIAAIAHGVDHSRDWPFVSLSSYQQRAFAAKLNSGALQVSIAPFVPRENRSSWEEYVVSDEAEVDWIERSIRYQKTVGAERFIKSYGTSFRSGAAAHSIKRFDPSSGQVVALPYDNSAISYIPYWEMSPFLSYDEVNFDMLQDSRGIHATLSLDQAAIVVGDMTYEPAGGLDSSNQATSAFSQLLSIDADEEVEYQGDPMTNIFLPIFDSFETGRKPVALLVGLFNWGKLFRDILPDSSNGVDVVLSNGCEEPYTFRVIGEDVIPLGKGDRHDPEFSHWKETSPILESGITNDGTSKGLGFATRDCEYFLEMYPSDQFADAFTTSTPAVLASVVAFVFMFAIGMFIVYDRLVERRQSVVLQKAVQSTAIVSSLFPKNVRDRLMKSSSPGESHETNRTISAFRDRMRNKSKLLGGPQGPLDNKKGLGVDSDDAAPIADLFPFCTVLFADISGFTAWSSTREPSQVFTLLQNLYQAFDSVATRRRVFKVETIGDSYVAVTGLPDPQTDHAVIMVKFAKDCLQKMHEVTRALEVQLGPDTTELSMRFGMNSGQVTGGVLRGDRARFQLFGDTVNTAARMESTGERGRIQLSQSTADLIIVAGKEKWLRAREDVVTAKGKGTLQTYWLEMDGQKHVHGDNSHGDGNEISQSFQAGDIASMELLASTRSAGVANKQVRLIGWMSEVLLDYVKQIVTKNKAAGIRTPRNSVVSQLPQSPGQICLDEMVESFALGGEKIKPMSLDYQSMVLAPAVVKQLHQYVEDIASRYHATNPFHNFDHACHVTMSVHKLMKRVVSDGKGNTDEWTKIPANQERVATYGILTSDPLTLFAIVFSGLIHDVDHKGVNNTQLSKEEPDLAKHYRNKSLAEQNSFDIAWDVLMSSTYDELRAAIFPTQLSLRKFRQVVINTVLATDIFDKEFSAMRKERWNRVFGNTAGTAETAISRNTRATIVLEHLIQASDVSHTMQHWHVYIKWNRKLFEEMRLAYQQGRMGSDPAEFWYQGELGFFDNYVIPLAKKLQECQVFGVSSNEYLNYALSNRTEWEGKGKEIVEDMIKKFDAQSGTTLGAESK